MKSDCILIEKKGCITIVTLNRPDKMNAFDEEMFRQLESAPENIMKNQPRAVIITGSGSRSFSSGFDVNPANPMVKRIIDAASMKDDKPAMELIAAIRRSVDSFASIPVPVIAALNGNAYGGGAELAMRCDLRVADPDAVICFSETKLGLMTDWGGGAALTRIAGPSKSAELILTARKVPAEEAYALGIISKISAKGKSLDEAFSMAEMISCNGPRAVRNSLMLIRESGNMTFRESLERESRLAVSLISSGECFHGVGAFLEKRKPVFPDVE
jgi:enoyl-CoA hydratase/carnithine racemase